MFEVIEHPTKGRMAVYSERDLNYMLNQGWVVVDQSPKEQTQEPQKKKPGRPKKGN